MRRRLDAAPGVLLAAQAVHVVGDAAIAVGLASTLYFDVPVGEARTDVALYLVLAFAPYAVMAPVIAALVARRTSAHGAVLVAADVGRALLAVLLAQQLDTAWIYPIGLGLLVLSRTHAVSRASLVPELVEESRLIDANAAIGLVSGVSGVVGAAMAGVASLVAGAQGALLVAAGVFALGALEGLWLRPPEHAAEVHPDAGWITGPRGVLVTAAILAARAAVGFVAMLLAFTFPADEHGVELALSLAALGLGTWLASVVGPWLRDVAPPATFAAFALAAMIPVALADLLLDGFPAAILLAASAGLVAGLVRLGFDVFVQEEWPPEARGPGYARYETLLQLGWVVGAAAGSFFTLSVHTGALLLALIATAGLFGGWLAGRTATDGAQA